MLRTLASLRYYVYMPSRNIYKNYVSNAYYHVYNRGVNKEPIFHETADFEYFMMLLERYVGAETKLQINGKPHKNYYGRVELIAYCLMRNHFHFFLFQTDVKGMEELLSSLTVAYSMYFNKKYKRVGPVFQQRYKAVQITDDAYFEHISRYIHLNPRDWRRYEWSSLSEFLNRRETSWVQIHHVMGRFGSGPREYLQFVADYEAAHNELEALKGVLADR